MKKQKLKISKIISGGQTGADRAAFDFALEKGLKIGGFVPKGRRAEDGKIADRYLNLVETETRNYKERTELNVINSDATIILSHGKLKGGSLLTRRFAKRHQKPFLHIDLSLSDVQESAENAKEFIVENGCKNLNIAGSRDSTDKKIYQKTREFLTNLFV